MTTPKQREARVTRTVRDFRKRLIEQEQTAIGSLTRSYEAAYQALLDELEAANRNARRAIDAGNPIVNTWRVSRGVELARQAERMLADISGQSLSDLERQRSAAARAAFTGAGDLLDAVMGEPPESFPNASSFLTLPSGAIEQLTGSLSGGPVQELLDGYNAGGAEAAGKILTGAIATGTHPSLIADALKDALNATLFQASRIARTEINRTFRESLRETMRANRHIIPKWRWRSGRSLRTCAACWAMDGKLFDVDIPMGTHPQCRCCLEPEPISWADLAAMHNLQMPPGDWSIPREPTGPEAFAALSAADQQAILDPGRSDGTTPRWDAFNAGQVELRDFVQASRSRDWGTTRRESGLTAALERSRKRNGGILPGTPVAPSAPSWRPAMPIADAEAFAAQGDLTRPLFHVTDAAGEAGITAEGFDLARRSWGRLWGRGVYLSDHPDSEALYAGAYPDPRKLELRVFSRKTLVVDISGIPAGQWSLSSVLDEISPLAKQRVTTLEQQIRVQSNLVEQDIASQYPYPAVYDYNTFIAISQQRTDALAIAEREGRYTSNPLEEAFTRTLEDYGYDALDLIDNPFRQSVGGSQVIVFDPQRVVVVQGP